MAKCDVHAVAAALGAKVRPNHNFSKNGLDNVITRQTAHMHMRHLSVFASLRRREERGHDGGRPTPRDRVGIDVTTPPLLVVRL
jgi:hypothetical protein